MSTKPAFTSRFDFDEKAPICIVTLSGNMSPEAVEELHPKVQDIVRTGCRRFVFDLSELHHIGSMGLRLLVGLHNQVKDDGDVTLCEISSKIQSILDLTKVHQILRTYPTRHAAIDAITSR